MLTFRLGRLWDIQATPPQSDLGQLPLPLLFNPLAPAESGQVYIACSSDLPAEGLPNRIGCLICCGGQPARCYEGNRYGLIVIDPEVRLDQVLNEVQGIFLLYQNWEEDLQTLVGSTTSMQELLDISAPVLRNLLCLMDEKGGVVYSTNSDASSDDDVVPIDLFDKRDRARMIKRVSKRLADRLYTFDIMLLEDESGPRALFTRYYLGRLHIVTLCMFPTEHPLQEHDIQLLETLALFVQIQILRPPQIESESLKSFAMTLLSGNLVKGEEMEALESALFLDESDNLRCVVIELPEAVIVKSGTFLQRRIKVEVPASIALIYEGYLVGLINETKSDWDGDKFYQSMKRCLGRTTFLAGISDGFMTLGDLRGHYLEAKATVTFADADEDRGPGRLLSFMDCWDSYIMKNCVDGLPPSMLFTPGFRRLKERGGDSSIDYIETLRAYLEEGRNDSRAASRLFICRNTFLYRLEKLKAILGEDLDDPDVRFRLEFCLRLDEMNDGHVEEG